MRWLLHRIRAAAIYLWRVVVSLETRLRLLGTILHEERKCPPGIPLRRRLWALRHGHFSNRIVLFGLNPGNVHEFIPEIPYLRAHPLNGRFSGLVDGKLQMYAALRDFPQYLPRLYFHVHEGMAFGYDASVARCARYRPEAVLEVLDREEDTVDGLYRRVRVTTGHGHTAWAYAYGTGLELTPIDSGDWLGHRGLQSGTVPS